MSTAQTKPARSPDAAAKKAAARRLELCTELLTIHKKHSTIFDLIEEIKTELKTIATDRGNFKEAIAGKGTVSVAGAKGKTLKGLMPTLQTKIWLELPPKEQTAFFKSGLVANEEHWTGAYYGAVTVNVF